MLSSRRRSVAAATRGLSLIELMVALAVLAVLLTASGPPLAAWLANAKVRSAAEQLQNSLRLAQSEALRRNRQTVVALTAAAPSLTATPVANGGNWFVRALPALNGETADDSHYVHGVAQPSNTAVTITGPALMCFNTIGRPVTNTSTGLGVNCSAPTNATTPRLYDLSVSAASKPLRIQVGLGGQIRLCDPAKTRSASAPDGC